MNQDLTEQKKAEYALRAAEKRNRALLDHSPVCHMIVDLDFNLQYMSHSGFRMLKLDEHAAVYGEPYPFDFFPEAFRQEMTEKLEEVRDTGGILTTELIASDVEGNAVWLHSTLIPVSDDKGELDYITVVSANATAERLLEARLRQSQKLEAIGTLASGVAHEINNPLMGMMNYAELVANKIDDSKSTEYLKEIGDLGGRIAKIVRNLLCFARQDSEERSQASMTDIVENTLTLIGSLLRKDRIAMEIDIPEHLPQLTCRSQQIEQVLINLLTNARSALNARYPEYDENKIIRITAHEFARDWQDWIRTTVEDHGVGISVEAAHRIFDPFFTTKSRTEGTGLGLSVSFGIVKEHQGELTMESTPFETTRFHMDLPVNSECNRKTELEEASRRS